MNLPGEHSMEELRSIVESTGCREIQEALAAMGGAQALTPDALEWAVWFVQTSPPDTQAAPKLTK